METTLIGKLRKDIKSKIDNEDMCYKSKIRYKTDLIKIIAQFSACNYLASKGKLNIGGSEWVKK